MRSSEQINEIVTALAKAQGEFQSASKDGSNPHFKSTYATLTAVWDSCRAPLSKYGLAVLQGVDVVEGKVIVTTTLAHTSGQWFTSSISMTPETQKPQAIGSACTYGKRYGLMAMIGVAAAEDDDDGNISSGKGSEQLRKPATSGLVITKTQSTPTVTTAVVTEELSKADLDALLRLCDQRKWKQTLMEFVHIKFNKDRIGALTRAEYDELTTIIASQETFEAMDEANRLEEGDKAL